MTHDFVNTVTPEREDKPEPNEALAEACRAILLSLGIVGARVTTRDENGVVHVEELRFKR